MVHGKYPLNKTASFLCITFSALHVFVLISMISINLHKEVEFFSISKKIAEYAAQLSFLVRVALRTREQHIAINYTQLALADYLFEVPVDLWPPSRALMYNSSAELRWKILQTRKVYITYGENCCEFSLARACETALSAGKVDECRAYNSSILDSDFQDRNNRTLQTSMGAGLWLWKPYIINRTLHEMADGEYLIYADAGIYTESPLHPLLVLLERLDANYSGVFTFGVGMPQRAFCKRDAFLRQRCDSPACHDAGQVNGALIVWRRGRHALRVVEAWLRDCEDYQVRFAYAFVESNQSLWLHHCYEGHPEGRREVIISSYPFGLASEHLAAFRELVFRFRDPLAPR